MAPTVNGRDPFPVIEHTWNRLHDVTLEASLNLKKAMKMLQELDSSDVFGQNQESRRKMCGKKAMSRVDRALRQLALHDTHMEELKVQMHVMREKLEISQGAQKEVQQRMNALASEMQEAVGRLRQEEEEKLAIAGDLEAAKLAADMAQRSASESFKKLQLKKVECEKLLRDVECFKIQNEKLARIKDKKQKYEANEKANLTLVTQIQRYKEVIAHITVDNMVFLMKLRHSEEALQVSKKKQKILEKEIENNRRRWLEEASAEIEDVVKDSLTKAEVCETELERLQEEEGKIVSKWEIKLQDANKRLAHVTAARDWLEETIVITRDRIKIMEEEKLHLQQRLDLEMEQRKHAEGDVQSLALTLRETTEQVNVVKGQYSGVLREMKALRDDLQTKEHEVEELLAALETTNLQLETQHNVNTAIMRKKEEMEWQLLEAEAQRNKL